jgi:hypothetical protein
MVLSSSAYSAPSHSGVSLIPHSYIYAQTIILLFHLLLAEQSPSGGTSIHDYYSKMLLQLSSYIFKLQKKNHYSNNWGQN